MRAKASSAANMSPVGPAPAMTTAWFVMATTVRHDRGLAASPYPWHTLAVERGGGALGVPFRATHSGARSARFLCARDERHYPRAPLAEGASERPPLELIARVAASSAFA